MGIQSKVTATVLTAVCLLGAPLRGPSADESEVATPMTLADAGVAAPNFVGIKTWLNSAPLSIAELRGKVLLVDFWTYGCYNCVNTLPMSLGSTTPTKTRALSSLGSTRLSLLSRSPPMPYKPPSSATASDIRWRKTTNMQRGTPTTTNIGQRSISSTKVGRSCSSMPVRVSTKRLNERFKSSSTSTAEGIDRVRPSDDARKNRRK
jgi:hypothetical protein